MEIEKEKVYADVMEVIDSLEGHKFEQFCAELLKNSGYRDVKVTQGSGDFGIDIIARYHNRIYGIQCKRYATNVGYKAVQEVYSGAEYYGCDIAVVLSNSIFTKKAIEAGKRIGVRLWDRNDLLDIIGKCENLSFVEKYKKEWGVKENNKTDVTKKKKQKKDTKVGCLPYLLLFLLIIFICVKIKNILIPGSQKKEPEKDLIFEWSNLLEEGHPYFSCDLEIANRWKNRYDDKIFFNESDYDYKESMVMELKSGVGKNEGMVVDVVVYYDKIENYNSEHIIEYIREYMPMDQLKMYYELKESYSLADDDSPDDKKYYLANWLIKDEYLEMYSADEFDGTYQITLEINEESDYIRINSKGIPNWACSSRLDFNGLVREDWDIQSLVMN